MSKKSRDLKKVEISPFPTREHFDGVNVGVLIGWLIVLYTIYSADPVSRDFPINDGGFWYVFSNQLLVHHFALPHTILFNGEVLPLAYPPLAAYLLAAVHRVTNVGVLRLLLWIPILLYPIVYLAWLRFARVSAASSRQYEWLAIVFPLLFHYLQWTLMGGGVARSIGLIAQLQTWTMCVLMSKSTTFGCRLLCGMWMAIAALSHPTAGLWAITGAVILLVPQYKILFGGLFTTLALILPWLLYVVREHGLSPYLNAFLSGGQSQIPPFLIFMEPNFFFGESVFLGCLGMLGVAALVACGKHRIPILVVLFSLVDPRGLSQANGVVLVAFTISYGISDGLSWLARITLRNTGEMSANMSRVNPLIGSLLIVALGANNFFPLVEAMRSNINSYQSADFYISASQIGPVKSAWLVDPVVGWDGLSEWTSVLADIRIENLHQMSEWRREFFKKLFLSHAYGKTCCLGERSGCQELKKIKDVPLVFVAERCPKLIGLQEKGYLGCRATDHWVMCQLQSGAPR